MPVSALFLPYFPSVPRAQPFHGPVVVMLAPSFPVVGTTTPVLYLYRPSSIAANHAAFTSGCPLLFFLACAFVWIHSLYIWPGDFFFLRQCLHMIITSRSFDTLEVCLSVRRHHLAPFYLAIFYTFIRFLHLITVQKDTAPVRRLDWRPLVTPGMKKIATPINDAGSLATTTRTICPDFW